MRWRLALLFLVGCGGGLPALPDAGEQSDASVDGGDARAHDAADEPSAPFHPADHETFPQAIKGKGGVLTAPNVVPVFFPNDALQASIVGFLKTLPSSGYWNALRVEYGVGPLTISDAIVVTDTAPASATEEDVAGFVASKLNAQDPSWPAASANNVYFVYYPSGTTLYSSVLGTGCKDFLGYHSYSTTNTSQNFIFAAQPRCSSTTFSQFDDATENTSHEIVEAATDPLFDAYQHVDTNHSVWWYYPGGELGDLCELEPLSYQRLIGTYLVQRFWSNAAAANGGDPCVPGIAAPYYNAVPVMTDIVNMTAGQSIFTTRGVSLPLNTTKTIDVELFSDAPTGDWTLDAEDSSYLFNTGSPQLQFTWDDTTGNNGDVRKLSIKRLQNGNIGGTEFVIFSSKSQTDFHMYFGFASN